MNRKSIDTFVKKARVDEIVLLSLMDLRVTSELLCTAARDDFERLIFLPASPTAEIIDMNHHSYLIQC